MPEESPHAGRKPTRRKKAHTLEEKFTSWKKTHNFGLPQLSYLPSNSVGSRFGCERRGKNYSTRAGIISIVTILLKTVDLHEADKVPKHSEHISQNDCTPKCSPICPITLWDSTENLGEYMAP